MLSDQAELKLLSETSKAFEGYVVPRFSSPFLDSLLVLFFLSFFSLSLVSLLTSFAALDERRNQAQVVVVQDKDKGQD